MNHYRILIVGAGLAGLSWPEPCARPDSPRK